VTVYRLTSARFPRCDGEGARLYGGRWNSRGRAVLYAAATQSLAVEILAHTAALSEDYVVIAIEVPADLANRHHDVCGQAGVRHLRFARRIRTRPDF